MTPTLMLRDYGQTFATRGRAQELRDAFLADLAAGDDAIVDFGGVTNITYSFADELVGKLCGVSGVRVDPVNMAPGVAATVHRAVARRCSAVS